MIYDPAREQPTTSCSSSSPRNPVQVLSYATSLYARIEGHNPMLLGALESGIGSLPTEAVAKVCYHALVGVGALEVGAHREYPTLIDAIAAAKHPTPVYHWCKGQYDQYALEVNDGNPHGLDVSKKGEYLAAGRDKLLRIREVECRGGVPDQEDIDFFSDLFADAHLRTQDMVLEILATSEPADGLPSKVH